MSIISAERVLAKLDGYLATNDTAAAERHLRYWLAEAEEMMGLFRKLGNKEASLSAAHDALATVERLDIAEGLGAATTYLNVATVYKAFGMAEKGIPFFERAEEIYEKSLPDNDARLGGLYNNMALSLVDLGRFEEAKGLYRRALRVMEQVKDAAPELAITYLNMASAAEAERGCLEATEEIESLLLEARHLLDGHPVKDGNYAYACEKCASVYAYYGHFLYAEELSARARRIYEGT